MRKIVLAITIGLTLPLLAQNQVNGYVKSNGTYVNPYVRSNADSIKVNNYGNYESSSDTLDSSSEVPDYSAPAVGTIDPWAY